MSRAQSPLRSPRGKAGMSSPPLRSPPQSARRSVDRNGFHSLTRAMTSLETTGLTPRNSLSRSRDRYEVTDDDGDSST